MLTAVGLRLGHPKTQRSSRVTRWAAGFSVVLISMPAVRQEGSRAHLLSSRIGRFLIEADHTLERIHNGVELRLP